MKTLTIGSLFSGIGGLELGLECALRDGGFSVETAWQCEQDEWCRGILARHWPHAVRHDDVRNVGAVPRSQYAGYVDLLCGGFPCQDLSYAGNGAGLAGERSGLWGEFARIVRELRPRVVVVEATEPGSRTPAHESWEPILLNAEYSFAYFDGLMDFQTAVARIQKNTRVYAKKQLKALPGLR